mmetsp:Transcript_30448/g.52134  ORF Transcript_30448/g.52134 Transcript_30448/m.52134 type:complete len:247 (-) Transcript_30448:68-808(-)
MLLSLVKRNTVKSKNLFTLRFASAEEIKNYKNDSKNLAKWLDVSTVSRHGREFDAYTHLQAPSKADTFPNAQVLTLESKSITIPTAIDAKAKLVCVSFKHYGFTLLRSWLNPFIAKYNPSAVVQKDQDGYIDTAAVTTTPGGLSNPTGAIAYEICFVEFGFLSMAKSLFASNIRGTVDPSQVNRTGMIFGGAKDFAAPLLLPNVYTGYAFLLDRNNKIRWKGSGQAHPEEVEALLRCTDELLAEKL